MAFDPERRTAYLIDRLRGAGYKITPQRIAIVKVLATSEAHPSVERIYDAIKTDFPTVSIATIYRNVMIIKGLGEVLELGFADGSNRYDGRKPYPHPHLVCTQCSGISDPELESIKHLQQELMAETGFEVTSHRLDFFGICAKCQKR